MALLRGGPAMSILLLLVPLSMALAACFLGGFIWAVRSGQYEDTCTPSLRLLMDEPKDLDEAAPPLQPEQKPRT